MLKTKPVKKPVIENINTSLKLEDCPRCGGPFSSYPAKSLTDFQTEICSACSTDENAEKWFEESVTPTTDWPVVRPWGKEKDNT